MLKEQILKIAEKNIDINHFIVLQLVAQNDDLDEFWQHVKIRSHREALIRKGWIIEIKNKYYLTEIGNTTYQNLKLDRSQNQDQDINENEDKEKIELDKNTIDPIVSLSKEILESLRELLLKKTGISRLTLSHGAFACSERELASRLYTYHKKFKIEDNKKIKIAILTYVEDILNKKIPYPRKLKYFIFKEEENGLVSDLQYYIENQEERKKKNIDYDGGFNL